MLLLALGTFIAIAGLGAISPWRMLLAWVPMLVMAGAPPASIILLAKAKLRLART
jgi:hypothetical protein